MSSNTGIEWTDSTWNPIRGCSRVSEGCRNCYAERHAYRFKGEGQPYEGLAQLVNGHAAWTGKVTLVEKHLLDPLKWRPVRNIEQERQCGCDSEHYRPRRIFVNSMSDLFHPNVPDEWIDRIFAVMALCPQHTFQVLTKRPERMLAYLTSDNVMMRWGFYITRMLAPPTPPQDLERSIAAALKWPLPNVHLGVSVEDQKTADERIPLLLQTPAAVRFISAEPLLGAVDLHSPGLRDELGWLNDGPDWVICGGESGPGARPMHPDWARGLRDQCVAAGVPFFFKQWGEWIECERRDDLPARPWMVGKRDLILAGGGEPFTFEECGGVGDGTPMRRAGKKAAGSLLDGREWKEFPR